MPSSRPKPDCFVPPNGVVTRTELFELIERTPVSIARAMRSARAESRVHTDPDRPYGVSLASRTASASSANGMTAATGPNTSSRATRSLFFASTSVGGNQYPRPLGAEARNSGVPSTNEATFVRWPAEISGPISVFESSGLPTRNFEIGVRKDHVGRLAAQLERDALDSPGGALHDPAADLGRAREADLGDVGVGDQALTDDRTGPDDHIEHAFGKACVERELGEAHGSERSQLGGLEHDGVAAGERRAELPAREHERKVPGHDQAHDAERLAERHVHAARHRDRLAVMLLDGARIEVEDIGDHAHLPPRVTDRLADVGGLQSRKLLGMVLDTYGDAAQQ